MAFCASVQKLHEHTDEYIVFFLRSDYLQLESKDKKGKELATSGWTLHSKEPKVSPAQLMHHGYQSVWGYYTIFMLCSA